jgi:small subunit ribosomal protein S6
MATTQTSNGSTERYETMVILKTIGTEAELAQAVAQLEDPVKRLGGRIEQSASWGRRRLAYRIAKHSEGIYHLIEFRLAAAQMGELKRLYQLNEGIVRFMILNRTDQKVAPAAEPATTAEPAKAAV